MRSKRLCVALGLVAGGLMLGYVFGPTAAGAIRATASPVTIQDRDSTTNADVTSKHRLSVDTEAGRTDLGGGNYYLNTFGLQYQLPNGQDILASGVTGCSKSTSNATVIAEVNVNLTSESAGVTTVTLKDKGTGNTVWQTSYDNLQMGSREATFDGGVYAANGYTVTATGTTGSLSCQVIGQDLGALGGRPSLHANSPRG